MGKIKYQGGLTKFIASKLGEKNKVHFSKIVDKNLRSLREALDNKLREVDVVSFSSSKDFYDQILSILSFLRYVGTPVSWTIYSDGSHTDQQKKELMEGFEFVTVVAVDWSDVENLKMSCKLSLLPYYEYLIDYAGKHPFGKRLYLYLNHKIESPTIFLDADVLFYNKASVIKALINENVNGWFLPDAEWGCLDSRYKKQYDKQLYQVNAGLLIFNQELVEVYEGLEFLKSLNYRYEYFSEQTVVHILLKANYFMPLDPRTFILNSADQFDFSYLYPRENMAIRHYTGPVRHKMWQRDWKWQLSYS